MSQSAVSRTFSRRTTSTGVSEATRAKVLKATRELGYRANALARSLVSQRSMIVGVLFSYLDNPFYAAAPERLCHALQARGFHALVLMMPDMLLGVDATMREIL